jgi:hypothetical protein
VSPTRARDDYHLHHKSCVLMSRCVTTLDGPKADRRSKSDPMNCGWDTRVGELRLPGRGHRSGVTWPPRSANHRIPRPRGGVGGEATEAGIF